MLELEISAATEAVPEAAGAVAMETDATLGGSDDKTDAELKPDDMLQ